MISQKAIDAMIQDTDVAWIMVLRSIAIRTLVQQGGVRMGFSMIAICLKSAVLTVPVRAWWRVAARSGQTAGAYQG